MRLLYIVLCCLMINTALNARPDNYEIDSLQDNAGKILMSLLATVYKHPFMTSWALYASTTKSRDIVTWFVGAFLLGDFAHNVLHAYKIKHHPCVKDICFHVNLESYKTRCIEVASDLD